MTEDDLEKVLRIECSSFSIPWKREHFLHEITAPHSFPFVAEYDGTVVGYVCLTVLFEESQILDIAVEPGLRGGGVAKALLDHAIHVAKEQGAEIMSLEVRESNIAAIALYERMGFQRCGTRTRYYGGVEDALLMEKTLQGDS